jgi:murein DD-endopeptidase MepM/ murein hydrolase activator NlpD
MSTSKSIKNLGELRDRTLRLGSTMLVRLRGRPEVAVLIAGVVAAVIVAGTLALTDGSPEQTAQAAVVSGAGKRQDAAQKAARSNRAPATTAPAPKAAAATPAPTKAAAKAPAKKVPAKKAVAKATPTWVSPMPGAPLSSCFGPRWGMMHLGVDFAGANGTPIRAVGAGTVFAAGWTYFGYGISVVIDHGNGYLTHYAHASGVLVKPGQKVKPNQPIALEGNTGDSTGPHLHFEVHHGMWNQVDPAKWLRAHGVKMGC